MAQANFEKTYDSFSGVDMIVTFGGIWIGALQGLSYSVTREKVPTYTMGNANPRSFSRGKRGISGALIFAVFDKDAMLSAMRKKTGQVVLNGNVNDETPSTDSNGRVVPDGFNHFNKGLDSAADLTQATQGVQVENVYTDQILPFNITVNGSNEYGSSTRMEIIGIELLASGSGMSIDDIQTNQSHSFLAKDVRTFEVPGGALNHRS